MNNAHWIFIVAAALTAACFYILPPFTTRIGHGGSETGEKLFITIGGVRQGIIIKGNDINKPVLLFLSGGPGIPEYFLEYRYPTGLQEQFIVCFWDWRGTGLSCSGEVSPQSMTHEQLISDTLEVTEYLRKRFSVEKIYLAAHSFGTCIGIQAAARRPELYSGYIAIGQMSDQPRSERLAYDYMLSVCKSQGRRSLLKRLTEHPFGTEHYFATGTRDRAMHALGVGTTRRMKSVISGIFFPSLRMTDYSVRERINIWRGRAFVGRTMKDNFSFNGFETVKRVDLPVYFFAGKYDYTCCYELQRQYFDFIKAPEKHFYTFENSAHSPIFEEPDRAQEILRHITGKSD